MESHIPSLFPLKRLTCMKLCQVLPVPFKKNLALENSSKIKILNFDINEGFMRLATELVIRGIKKLTSLVLILFLVRLQYYAYSPSKYKCSIFCMLGLVNLGLHELGAEYHLIVDACN